MPAPPRFDSERTQKAAIAVAMALILTCALSAAAIYSYANRVNLEVDLKTVELHGITFDVPDQWQQGSRPAQSWEVSDPISFNAPGPISRSLQIVQLAAPANISPHDMLNFYLLKLQSSYFNIKKLVDNIERERVNNLFVARFITISKKKEDKPQSTDHLAIVTDDSNHHWLFYLRGVSDQDGKTARANERLLNAIIKTVRLNNHKPATSTDMNRAMVQFHHPPDGTLSVPSSQHAFASSITMGPTNETLKHIAFIRIRGTIDTGVDNPKSKLSPIFQLRKLHQDIHGQPPARDAIQHDAATSRPTWRMPLTNSTATKLKRELRYVRIAQGYGAIIDVSYEEPAKQYAMRLADQAQQLLIPATSSQTNQKDNTGNETTNVSRAPSTLTPPSDIPPPAPITTAYARGHALVQSQKDALKNTTKTDWRFYTLHNNQNLVGAQVALWYRTNDPDQPIRGSRMWIKPPFSKAEALWWSNPDATNVETAWWQRKREGMSQRDTNMQIILKDEKIAYYGKSYITNRPTKLVSVPQPYLPVIASQTWPTTTITDAINDQPAFVWLADEGEVPAPHWIRIFTLPQQPQTESKKQTQSASIDANTKSAHQATAVIIIRSMMSIDSQLLWIDHKGRIIKHVKPVTKGAPTGGAQLVLTEQNRNTLLQEFPELQPTLDRWLVESSNE